LGLCRRYDRRTYTIGAHKCLCASIVTHTECLLVPA
jgi:hypothetical protein